MGSLPRIMKFKKLEVFSREGMSCYFDPYRNVFVKATSEEEVRQKTAAFFEELLNVPHDMIDIEVPLVHYAGKNGGRADILISTPTSKGKKPLAVIECKGSEQDLTTTARDQAVNYAMQLTADYIFVTNGTELLPFKFDLKNKKPVALKDIPNFDDMKTKKAIPYKKLQYGNIRPSMEDYKNVHLLEDRWEDFGGCDTPKELWLPLCNYHDALMDYEHKLPSVDRGFFKIIEDRGIVLQNNTNRSGEGYFGNYRSFIVKLRRGGNKIVNISIFGIDPYFEDRGRGYTSLVVSTNQKTISHNILQLNIDDFAKLTAKGLTITHNGRISSLKSSTLMAYIGRQDTKLSFSEGGQVLLGTLPIDRLFNLDDPVIAEFTYNLIEYGLLRERFRNSKARARKGRTQKAAAKES